MRKKTTIPSGLVATTDFTVRFSEVDAMRVVWHGNYAVYLEDGREAFGRIYPGLGYDDISASGYGAPIVDMKVRYLSPLKMGESAVVEVRYIASEAAKICFEYVIRRADNGSTVATASTVQVFVDNGGELQLTGPDFYLEWKRRWGVE